MRERAKTMISVSMGMGLLATKTATTVVREEHRASRLGSDDEM